jgi:hypothetical protein
MKMMKRRAFGFVGLPETRADDLARLGRRIRSGSSSLQSREGRHVRYGNRRLQH